MSEKQKQINKSKYKAFIIFIYLIRFKTCFKIKK